eukprot:gene5171-5924_t
MGALLNLVGGGPGDPRREALKRAMADAVTAAALHDTLAAAAG